MIKLVEATQEDVPALTQFLLDMDEETKEFVKFELTPELVKDRVEQSFDENVHWFLFYDDEGTVFGTCHCQSVYNYWRHEKRFFLGGFYIVPSHRGQGHFVTIHEQLKNWAVANNGVQIYAHINAENEQSLKAFDKAGFEGLGYVLYYSHWGD